MSEVGSCKHDNELSASIKQGNVLRNAPERRPGSYFLQIRKPERRSGTFLLVLI
jgi:hypothetical protein